MENLIDLQDDSDLGSDAIPDAVRQMMEAAEFSRLQRVESLGKLVSEKRNEAIKSRLASGIERTWTEDEEYYLGIDDANRNTSTHIKPPGMTGGLSSVRRSDPSRSTAFFNITGQFCDSASARMGDILLPAGDWNFAIKATPVPEFGGPRQPVSQAPPAPRPTAPSPSPLDAGMEQSVSPVNAAEDFKAQAEKSKASEAVKKAESAETQIRDWLTECSYHSEVRKTLEDCTRLGVGILKGPVPKKAKSRLVHNNEGQVSVEFIEETVPASYRISPWDFFPDPACGENIHDGSYVLERDLMTSRQLRDLKGLPGYLAAQIDQVLDEGPSKCNYVGGIKMLADVEQANRPFEVWYYYGDVDLDSLDAMGVKGIPSKAERKNDACPAVVTLVNDTAIKAFLNPLDTGGFPYDVIPWQQLAGSPWGVGVARKGRTAQDMLNASARAMMDNAGLSSGPMLIIRDRAIRPQNGDWTLAPRKIWVATEESDVKSPADAIMAINIPMMQGELSAIMQLAKSMMEEATGIFFLMQGQQGSAPDTVGGMQLLHVNSSAILRRLARIFDERVTEPHIRRYYDWLLQYGPENCKGDMQIEAIGSTALVERDIQLQQLIQLLQASLNPAYGLDPEKAMAEVLKSQKFIPEKLQLDQAKKASMQQQPQIIPAVEAAKIRADAELRKEKIRATSSLHRAQVDTDRDTAYTQAMQRRDESNALSRKEELKIKRETALMNRDMAIADYANKRGIALDKAKAELAKTAMSLRTQREIALATNKATQVVKPEAEPPNRAKNGEAFQR